MWKRFWKDFSIAMLMLDPMAYGLYVAWGLETERHLDPDMARRAPRPEATRFKPALSHSSSPAGAEVG